MDVFSEGSSINRHYLNKVMDLAEVMPVVATDDIYDARGMKLLAKGARVSNTLQEKLILHKLKKPIETSLSVEGGIQSNTVVATARRVLEYNSALTSIVGATCSGGFSPLNILSNMAFGNAMTMMLTISERDGSQSFEHSVTVSLLAICIARRLKLNPQELQVVGLAGLLHDIGELYIDPDYLMRGKRIPPHQWAHLVVHPRIGQMVISEFESYPPGVARAVAEHHERFDGSGYPRRLSDSQISVAGQTVAIAEMISGLLGTDHPLERAELALKLIPHEYAHGIRSALTGALHFSRLTIEQAREKEASSTDYRPTEEIDHLYARITSSLEKAQKLYAESTTKPQAIKDLLAYAIDRIKVVQRAFFSTGIDGYMNQAQIFSDCADSFINFEKDVATHEIQWRLRDIARDIALYGGVHDENSGYSSLINLLDEQTAEVNA